MSSVILSLETLDKVEKNIFSKMSAGKTTIEEYRQISNDLSHYLRTIQKHPGAYKNDAVEERVKIKLAQIWMLVEMHINELESLAA